MKGPRRGWPIEAGESRQARPEVVQTAATPAGTHRVLVGAGFRWRRAYWRCRAGMV